jgi:hypothetical protein
MSNSFDISTYTSHYDYLFTKRWSNNEKRYNTDLYWIIAIGIVRAHSLLHVQNDNDGGKGKAKKTVAASPSTASATATASSAKATTSATSSTSAGGTTSRRKSGTKTAEEAFEHVPLHSSISWQSFANTSDSLLTSNANAASAAPADGTAPVTAAVPAPPQLIETSVIEDNTSPSYNFVYKQTITNKHVSHHLSFALTF